MKVALGQEEETVAQGLPGSLMYVLYEELCTKAWCIQDPVGFLGNYGPNKFWGQRRLGTCQPSTLRLNPGAGLAARARATSL